MSAPDMTTPEGQAGLSARLDARARYEAACARMDVLAATYSQGTAAWVQAVNERELARAGLRLDRGAGS